MKLTRYQIVQNNKVVFVSGINLEDAQEICMNRYGFWPEQENMTPRNSDG